ncbi:Fc.00g096200.m01.CDS01 [Cosmosporella sp. VM-42]
MTLLSWTVAEFTSSDRNTDSEAVLMCNHKTFVKRSSADNFSESPHPKGKYLFFLEVAENFKLDGYTVEDLYDWMVEPLLPFLETLSPADEAQKLTLHDFVFPETLVYTLRSHSDKLIAVPFQDSQEATSSPRCDIILPDEDCASWPSFRPSEVRRCVDVNNGPPSQMTNKITLVDGAFVFFKLVRAGDRKMLRHEIDGYKRIDTAALDDSLRIPRLKGLAHDAVLCREPRDAQILQTKWATQLQDSIRQLHNAVLVWGDAKPDNVLIDGNNDAWIVDFGGGYTDGWVPKELAGTTEGDLCALKKILEFTGEQSST